MGTYVRVAQGDDPARRSRRVLRLCRAARRPTAARPPGHRRRRRRARRRATRRRACGVRTAMGGARARRLCPDAVVVDAADVRVLQRPARTCSRCSRNTTPLVEGISIDEAFLDVGGLRAGVRDRRPRSRARLRAGRARAGRSADHRRRRRTKFLAKVASGVAKPDGLLVVPPDDELGFLHPLPVERLWGVGPATTAKLRDRRHHTVGQVAGLDERALVSMLGPARRPAPARARSQPRPTPGAGGPPPPVDRRSARARSRRRGRSTRSTSPSSGSSTGSRGGFGAPGVRLGRSCSGCASTISHERHVLTRSRVRRPRRRMILSASRDLLAAATPTIQARGLTLVGLTLDGPRGRGRRAADAASRASRDVALDAAVDLVRDRFGAAAVTRGVLVGRDPGIVDAHPAGLTPPPSASRPAATRRPRPPAPTGDRTAGAGGASRRSRSQRRRPRPRTQR